MLGKLAEESWEQRENVLLVTHGDILAQWVDMTTRETVMECGYCGWIVSKAPPVLNSFKYLYLATHFSVMIIAIASWSVLMPSSIAHGVKIQSGFVGGRN